MLQTRRLLAFSSRVHTYTLLLYLFFFLVYILGSFFSVDPTFVTLLQFMLHLISWTSLLFGFWILVFSVVVWVSDRIFPFSTAILTVLRMLAVFALSLVVALLEQVIQQGLVVSL
ncbi:MAG: hypothetical protein GX315_06300 [Spirochaetales bacterium]|nr:hypothetical protein [Spirochaetales bacterium]